MFLMLVHSARKFASEEASILDLLSLCYVAETASRWIGVSLPLHFYTLNNILIQKQFQLQQLLTILKNIESKVLRNDFGAYKFRTK